MKQTDSLVKNTDCKPVQKAIIASAKKASVFSVIEGLTI